MNREHFRPPRLKNDMTSYLRKQIKGARVAILIDAANLYHAAIIAELRIDFTQISSWFHENSAAAALHFYTAFDPDDKKQKDFFESLEAAKYTVVKKPLRKFENLTKGNMDIELAVDALMLKDSYDILVLLSGDGDFHYLVKAVEKMGKKTVILGIGGFTSYELHQEADSYFFLNRISSVWKADRRVKSEQEAQYVVSTDDFQQAYFQNLISLDYETRDSVMNEMLHLPGKQVKERNSRSEVERTRPAIMKNHSALKSAEKREKKAANTVQPDRKNATNSSKQHSKKDDNKHPNVRLRIEKKNTNKNSL